jgi:AAA+ lid domain/Polysaccharide pyruvyl transferase
MGRSVTSRSTRTVTLHRRDCAAPSNWIPAHAGPVVLARSGPQVGTVSGATLCARLKPARPPTNRATNRPDLIDPALLRRGRLERLVYLPPPDGPARLEILRATSRHTPMAPEVDLAALASSCEGFSGADLTSLVREAAMCAMRRSMASPTVTAADIEEARARSHRHSTPPRSPISNRSPPGTDTDGRGIGPGSSGSLHGVRIGLFGTFDVENYGDVQFPLMARHELAKRIGDVPIVPYGYRRKRADTWPFSVRSLVDLDADLGDLDVLVVGGGHLARFDKEVAVGYEPLAPWIAHPCGYWLAPMLTGIARGIPVAWNALSVSADPPVWARPFLAQAVRGSAYVSVRDTSSLEILELVEPAAAVDVIPDSVFGIAEAFPLELHRRSVE